MRVVQNASSHSGWRLCRLHLEPGLYSLGVNPKAVEVIA